MEFEVMLSGAAWAVELKKLGWTAEEARPVPLEIVIGEARHTALVTLVSVGKKP